MQNINDNILQMSEPFPEEENMTDPEFAFWDEFYRDKNEEDTSLKFNIPFNNLKHN